MEHLKPVELEEDPFKELVLRQPVKDLLESMVDTSLNHESFEDIVKEKGRGLIVLLHGAPGTGKTLTAGM